MSIELRSGTNDAVIFESVITRNEYRLPARLPGETAQLSLGLFLRQAAGRLQRLRRQPAGKRHLQVLVRSPLGVALTDRGQ